MRRSLVPMFVSAALALAAAGCGNDLVGDWFKCQSGDCSKLADDGIRFRSDQTFSGLEATGSTLEPEEKYCEARLQSAVGRWEYDGATLKTMPDSGGEEVVELKIDGDQAKMVVRGEELTWQRIVEPRSTGACADIRLE